MAILKGSNAASQLLCCRISIPSGVRSQNLIPPDVLVFLEDTLQFGGILRKEHHGLTPVIAQLDAQT